MLEALQMLVATPISVKEITMTEETARLAAAHGHLKVLDWLFEKGCPCNQRQMATTAIESDSAATLHWIREHAHEP